MSDYDELDDHLYGALEHAATPADPGGAFDNVVVKKKHRADMRSLRIRGAALLSVVVLAATLIVATSGGSRPKTTNVASGETPTSSQEGDGVVNPEGAVPGGDSGSTTTSTPNASAAHGSKHGTTTTTPAKLGGAVAIDNGPQAGRVVTCQRPTRVASAIGVKGPVHFLDEQHGWVLPSMGWGGFLSTADGGKTWFQTACNYGPIDVDFVSPEHGWAVGDGFIISTTDGGQTWTQQTLPPWPPEASLGNGDPWSLTSVSFADATHGWAVGNADATLATTDGGAHWRSQTTPTYKKGALLSVSFPDDQHGWVVGGMGGEIAKSTDNGGATWVSHENIGYNVDFVDAAHGWAGAGKAIRATTDGGATWHDQLVGTGPYSYFVDFVDLQHGWAITTTENGTSNLFATTDGGATWQQLGNPPNYAWRVSFVDSLHGWATGGGGIYATVDGGATWAQQLAE